MLYLEQFSFKAPKLLVFCLGGNIEKSHIEMHDVVFIVASTAQEATEQIKKKWYGTAKSLHVDSWYAVEELEGYNISVTERRPQESLQHLYFVNLGYYKRSLFGEHHFMTLVIAGSKPEAIKKAKGQCTSDCEMLHNDNIYDLDDCVRIDSVDRFFIDLQYTGEKSKELIPINGFQLLSS